MAFLGGWSQSYFRKNLFNLESLLAAYDKFKFEANNYQDLSQGFLNKHEAEYNGRKKSPSDVPAEGLISIDSRGYGIWTHDLLHPKQAR